MKAVVVGNATLDVICFPVEEVPRFDSLSFEKPALMPGGCGSNVAVGLAALQVQTGLVACLGTDDTAWLARRYWERWGIDLRFVRQESDLPTGVSVGLVDRSFQPRFIHTSGANQRLTPEAIHPGEYADLGARLMLVVGYFVLPGLLNDRLPPVLATARHRGLEVVLDVVHSPAMDRPAALWPCLPEVDLFLCNRAEAQRLLGVADPQQAATEFRRRGAGAVVIKLGADGCWLDSPDGGCFVQSECVEVVDTTGAGDAFAAGLGAARLQGADWVEACRAASRAGARVVTQLGAVAAWGTPPERGEP